MSCSEEQELVRKAQQCRLDVVGILSTKRRDSETVELNGGWKIFYSGVDAAMSAQAGVGLLVSPNMAECVVDWVPVGGRVCLLKLWLQEKSLCTLLVYAPNMESQSETFLEDVEVAWEKQLYQNFLSFWAISMHMLASTMQPGKVLLGNIVTLTLTRTEDVYCSSVPPMGCA